MNISKKVAVIFSVVGLAAGTAGTIAYQTHAADNTTTNTQNTSQGKMHKQGMRGMMGKALAAEGAVTAINGNTITLTDKRTGTTFTVDASSATIQKINAPTPGLATKTKPTPTTITASGIAVGDNIIVQGTVSGTNIVATKIVDVAMGGFGIMGGFKGEKNNGTAGTVTAVNGNVITLTGRDGKTYTINAGSATIKKIATASVSDIKAGDTLMANGSISGTTVNATQIVDGELGDKK